MSGDPFQDAHRAGERKAAKDDAAQEIVSRDARITATKDARDKAARPQPPHPWPKKFFEP